MPIKNYLIDTSTHVFKKTLTFKLSPACMLLFKSQLFILFFLILFQAKSQNLVPNPSFENTSYIPCDFVISKSTFNDCIKDWTIPTDGTSDIFSNLAPQSCYANCFSTNIASLGTQAPRTGNNMCGFFAYGNGGVQIYREYIQVQLTSPLIVGKKYYAEIYVSLAETERYSCNNIGMYFSANKIGDYFSMTTLPYTPQIKSSSIIADTENWVKISGTFTANTAMQYLTIGNFSNNINTAIADNYIANTPTVYANAYYYIDDVLVKNICDPKDASATICKGNSITLKLSDTHVTGWSLENSPNTLISNTSTADVSPQVTTTYLAHYDCGETSSYKVIVDTILNPNLGNDTTICIRQKITLHTLTGNNSFMWQDGSQNPTYTVRKTGLYSLTVTNSCGNFYDEVFVKVDIPSFFTFGTDTTICKDETIYFNAKTDNATYLWQDGSTNSQYTITDTGSYSVTIKNACGIVQRHINLSNCCEGAIIPNLITPNGDGKNETFDIGCLGIGDHEILIYNEWGALLYHNLAYINNWGNKDVSDGIYYYEIRYKTKPVNKGWLQVLK